MPFGVLGFADIVKVVVPEPGTDVGENEEFARAGSPLTLKVTAAENGPNAATETVKVVFEFPLTVRLLGDAETEKSDTSKETFAVCVMLPLVAEIVRV